MHKEKTSYKVFLLSLAMHIDGNVQKIYQNKKEEKLTD